MRDFVGALKVPGLSVIAEIKRRSPSAGPLAPGLDPVGHSRAYVSGGAAAISVLTEPEFFDGTLDDLVAVRDSVDVPILRKDFILDPVQVHEARAVGADALLLIVAVLDDARLERLKDETEALAMTALVEVHTSEEAKRAAAVGASVIGVNNRDLGTFITDLSTAEVIASDIPVDAVTVAESGVSDAGGAQRMRSAGFDAILVGEALVRSDDPSALLGSLRVP